MSRLRAGLALASGIVGAVLLLAGCASASTGVSISFDDGDGQTTVSGNPASVRCTTTSASGIATDAPQTGVTVQFGDGAQQSSVSAWVHDERIYLFEARDIDIETDGDRIRIDAAQGTVAIAEAEPGAQPDAGAFDTENAIEVDGSLTIDLTCDR